MMPQLTTTDSGICSPNTETISTFSSSFKAAVNAFILLLYLLSLLSFFRKSAAMREKKQEAETSSSHILLRSRLARRFLRDVS